MNIYLLSFHISDCGVDQLGRLSSLASARFGALESYYLSTCNRVEWLLAFEETFEPADLLSQFEIRPIVYQGPEQVTHHLLEVAMSKDSMVFGESEILGQMKTAYESGLEKGTIGKQLSPLLNLIIREAKAIRRRLNLCHHHKSVATVAADQLTKNLKDKNARILFVGAGNTNQTAAQYLAKRDYDNITWCNRTPGRAQEISEQLGGKVLDFASLASDQALPYDVIFFATNAKKILLKRGHIATNNQWVIDLSVPRNANKQDVESSGSQYLGIEELNELLAEKQEQLRETLLHLNENIERSVENILDEVHLRKSADVFAQTIRQAEKIHSDLISEEMGRELKGFDDRQREIIERFSRRLVKKLAHDQIETLRKILSREKAV